MTNIWHYWFYLLLYINDLMKLFSLKIDIVGLSTNKQCPGTYYGIINPIISTLNLVIRCLLISFIRIYLCTYLCLILELLYSWSMNICAHNYRVEGMPPTHYGCGQRGCIKIKVHSKYTPRRGNHKGRWRVLCRKWGTGDGRDWGAWKWGIH